MSQILGDPQLFRGTRVHGGLESHPAIASVCLCPIHRYVGIPHERVGRRLVRVGNDDANTCAYPQAHVLDEKRLTDKLEDSIRHFVGKGGVLELFKEESELVSAETPNRVTWPSGTTYWCRDLFEGFVTSIMTHAVVDRLEAIEVKHEYRYRTSRTTQPREGVAEPVAEECTIGEASERILERLAGKLLFESPAVRYITRMPCHSMSARCEQQIRLL